MSADVLEKKVVLFSLVPSYTDNEIIADNDNEIIGDNDNGIIGDNDIF